MHHLGPQVPNFHLFRSTISLFKILHIYDFPIDAHVKISKCDKIVKTYPIAKKSSNLFSTMVAKSNVLISLGEITCKL